VEGKEVMEGESEEVIKGVSENVKIGKGFNERA